MRAFLSMSAGIVLGRSYTWSLGVLFTLILMLWLLGAILKILAYRWRIHPLPSACALSMLMLVSGMLLARTSILGIDTGLVSFADENNVLSLTGTVESEPTDNGRVISFRIYCDTVRASRRSMQTSSLIRVSIFERTAPEGTRPPVFRIGDRLLLRGKLTTPRPQRNPGAFDARAYSLQEVVTAHFRVSGFQDVQLQNSDHAPFVLAGGISHVRRSLFSRLDSLFDRHDSDLLRGLLFGDRSRIDQGTKSDFRDSGVIHILSVSGTHVGILLAMLWLVLGRVSLSARVYIALCALWFYAFLTDLSPPVLRAVVMASIFLMALPLQRITNSIHTWAVSGIVLLVLSPQDLFSPSFQLSFAAVLSILLFHQRIIHYFEKRFPFLMGKSVFRHLTVLSVMTFTAQVGTLPLLVVYFKQISLVSFAANLFIVPLTFLVMATSIPALLFSYAAAFPANYLAIAAHHSLHLVLLLSAYFARVPFAVLHVQSMPLWMSILYVAGILWMSFASKRLRQKVFIGVLSVCAIVLVARRIDARSEPEALLRMLFLDVSQGDASVFEVEGGNTMLIDTGPSSESNDEGERTIVPALRTCGIERIDILLLTHFDDDHIGGARSVMEALDVRRVVAPQPLTTDTVARKLLDYITARRIALSIVKRGTCISLSNQVRCWVLSPVDAIAPTANAASVVVLLQCGMTRILCTGDAPESVENDMLDHYGSMLKADLYKAGHHGSKTSSGRKFLSSVRPAYTVISCGRFNRFGHPSQETLRRLSDVDSEIYRTDVSGALMFVSDGLRITPVDWQSFLR